MSTVASSVPYAGGSPLAVAAPLLCRLSMGLTVARRTGRGATIGPGLKMEAFLWRASSEAQTMHEPWRARGNPWAAWQISKQKYHCPPSRAGGAAAAHEAWPADPVWLLLTGWCCRFPDCYRRTEPAVWEEGHLQ